MHPHRKQGIYLPVSTHAGLSEQGQGGRRHGEKSGSIANTVYVGIIVAIGSSDVVLALLDGYR